MTDRQLVKYAKEFRAGLLDGRSSFLMCFAVCAPLQAMLSLSGVETELVETNFIESNINHVWLRLPDGRILDPTADQFGLAPVYLGPLLKAYKSRQARLVYTEANP